MFKLEKLKDRARLKIYGYVGGILNSEILSAAIDEITASGLKRVDFHIHTYGGSVFEGNLMGNFLSSFDGEIHLYIDGLAASMGAMLTTYVKKENVHIVDNGFMMIHAPQGGGYGTAKQLVQTAKLLTSMEKNFKVQLAERMSKTDQEVAQYMDGTDYWFDADECVAKGLAHDKVKPIVKDIKILDKSEASQIGARATYDRFAASLIANSNSQISNKKPSQMDKLELINRYKLTGVTADSTDEQVLAAVDAKIAEGQNAAKAAAKAAIETVVDKAIAEKKITKENRDKYVARGEKVGVEELTAIFDDMKVYEPVSQHIKGKGEGSKSPEDRTGWDWDKYQAQALAELEAMVKSDPDQFKALYKAKYGVEPEI